MFTQIYVWRNVRARGNEVRKGGRGETEERAGPGKRGLGGSHPRAQIPGGEEEEGRARLFSAVSSDGTGDNGHSLKHRKFSLNTRKKRLFLFGFALFSCCEGGQTMAWVSQRGYGVSLWRDAHSPAARILSEQGGQGDPQRSLPTLATLWCNHKVPTPWVSSSWEPSWGEHQARW